MSNSIHLINQLQDVVDELIKKYKQLQTAHQKLQHKNQLLEQKVKELEWQQVQLKDQHQLEILKLLSDNNKEVSDTLKQYLDQVITHIHQTIEILK